MQRNLLGVVEVPSLVVVEFRQQEGAPEGRSGCPKENRDANGQQK
jgi:hypothetical protein